MKLKFTYQRPDGTTVDLVATTDSQATVGDMADFLVAADPRKSRGRPGHHTVCVIDRGNQLLDRDLPLADSPLRSGTRVSVLPASGAYRDRETEHADAVLRIEKGPGAPQEFSLAIGSSVVGREPGCDVRLPDPMISRRHVRINVTDIVEVHDLGSANGTLVGHLPVTRAALRPSDVVEIGDTQFSVRRVHQPHMATRDEPGASQAFVRSPLITPRYEGAELDAPQAPERGRRQRLPMVLLIVPILMGGFLYAATGNKYSLLFIAMSPMMAIGNWYEQRRNSRLDFVEAVSEFEEDLKGLEADLVARGGEEVAVRSRESPPSSLLLDEAARRGPSLWSRRPDNDDFLAIRLGTARLASRTTVEAPRVGRAPYELTARTNALIATHATVGPVPVVGALRASALGVAGPRRTALSSARSLVAQVVSLHSPAEVVVTAFLSAATAPDWDWLKWLPHTSSPQSPVTGGHLAASPALGVELVNVLEELIEVRTVDFVASVEEPAVLVIVEVDPPVEHNRLVHLAELGAARGVHVIWLATDWTLLPAACKTFVSVSPSNDSAAVGLVTDRVELTPVALDTTGAQEVEDLARGLAPVVDLGARVVDASDIPRHVGHLALLGRELGDGADAVIERWQESGSILDGPYSPLSASHKAGHLRAVLGQSAAGAHTIDLRSDGPHALVGGTTGAGKSELLQAWILSMATTNSPQRITFLLVDYKGGSAFADCTKLPHTIGLVTDLSPSEVRRALTSLGAELKYREELLKQHNAKDLMELERQGVPGTPPSLVIVVDEFAALVNDVPEFIEGVVNVAQRGRSLGLHLILATQQPSGVIKGSLRANTNLRIALRMADEGDSTDVLGSPDAAGFDPDVPGRAMSRSGPTRLVSFQTAYAGGWSGIEEEPVTLQVGELSLTTAAMWSLPDVGEGAQRDRSQTDIKRLVNSVRAASRIAQLPEPRKAWQPVLSKVIDLRTIREPVDRGAWIFALGDDPDAQSQPAITFRPDREGNLAVYGTGGSGKSALLRSLAVAAGVDPDEDPCHVYGLDFGSRALQMLERLPHVGAIVQGADEERVGRLILWLREVLNERSEKWASVSAGTITEYRLRAEQPHEPRILLLIDNVGAFRSANEGADRARYVELLTSIASEGRGFGVHLAMSAGDRTAIHTNLSSSVQRRIVMRMASGDDYSLLGVPSDVLDSTSVPGRALDGNKEIQVALLGTQGDDANQASEMKLLAKAMRSAGVGEAPSVGSLDADIDLSELTPTNAGPAVGVAFDTLQPVSVDAHGAFLVTGPPASGRTTAMLTLAVAAQRWRPMATLHYLGHRRGELATWNGWTSASFGPEEITLKAQQLTEQINAGVSDAAPVLVFVENAGELVMSPAEPALQALVKACVSEDQWFVVEGESSSVKATSGYLSFVKASRRGLALQPDQENGAGLFNTAFPRINRRDFPKGRGFLVGAGRARIVQIAQVRAGKATHSRPD